MKASINPNAVTHELTITIEGLNWEDIEQASFYEGEVQVRELLKLIGQELTLHLLRSKAVDAPTLTVEGKTYYRKDASLGHYHTLYGEVGISPASLSAQRGWCDAVPTGNQLSVELWGGHTLANRNSEFQAGQCPSERSHAGLG